MQGAKRKAPHPTRPPHRASLPHPAHHAPKQGYVRGPPARAAPAEPCCPAQSAPAGSSSRHSSSSRPAANGSAASASNSRFDSTQHGPHPTEQGVPKRVPSRSSLGCCLPTRLNSTRLCHQTCPFEWLAGHDSLCPKSATRAYDTSPNAQRSAHGARARTVTLRANMRESISASPPGERPSGTAAAVAAAVVVTAAAAAAAATLAAALAVSLFALRTAGVRCWTIGSGSAATEHTRD